VYLIVFLDRKYRSVVMYVYWIVFWIADIVLWLCVCVCVCVFDCFLDRKYLSVVVYVYVIVFWIANIVLWLGVCVFVYFFGSQISICGCVCLFDCFLDRKYRSVVMYVYFIVFWIANIVLWLCMFI
jgi:hypothetical protein